MSCFTGFSFYLRQGLGCALRILFDEAQLCDELGCRRTIKAHDAVTFLKLEVFLVSYHNADSLDDQSRIVANGHARNLVSILKTLILLTLPLLSNLVVFQLVSLGPARMSCCF